MRTGVRAYCVVKHTTNRSLSGKGGVGACGLCGETQQGRYFAGPGDAAQVFLERTFVAFLDLFNFL